jgi:hypothetical protein
LKITVGDSTYERTISEFLNNQLNKIDYRNNTASTLFLNKFKSYKQLSDFTYIKAGVKLYEKGKGIPPQSEKTVNENHLQKRQVKISLKIGDHFIEELM